MKRILIYLGVAIAAIGCSKDDITQSSDNALTITTNIATRVADDQWEKDDPIGVYMTSISDDATLGEKGANVKYTTADGDGIFTSEDPLYFPSSGEAVEIFAYYPYDESVNITAYEIKSGDQVDLLSATNDNVTKSSSNVALTFNHLLSKISLTIEAGDGLEAEDLDNLVVKLSGISSEATFDLTMDEVTTTNTDAELTLETTEDVTSASAIVIPQSLSDAVISFTTDSYGTFSATLATKAFEIGMAYTYSATINRDGVEITEANIELWDDGGTVDGTADIVDIEYKSDGKYYINSAKGLAAFRDLVNMSGSNTQDATFAGFQESAFALANTDIDGKLTTDIDLSTVCSASLGNWTPIGSSSDMYSGTFDGGGYMVQKLYIRYSSNIYNTDEDDDLALFAYVGESGLVCNLGVSGNIYSFNGYRASGIVASNYGSVINCYNETLAQSGYYVGGIVGYNEGNVVNCYNLVEITANRSNGGGIVGLNDGYIDNCYSAGTLDTESGSGDGILGGIVGTNSGTVTSCYWNTSVTSEGGIGVDNNSQTVTGYSTSVMQSENFAVTLNNGAYTYNETYPDATQASGWSVVSGGYPAHVYGSTPNSNGTYTEAQ